MHYERIILVSKREYSARFLSAGSGHWWWWRGQCCKFSLPEGHRDMCLDWPRKEAMDCRERRNLQKSSKKFLPLRLTSEGIQLVTWQQHQEDKFWNLGIYHHKNKRALQRFPDLHSNRWFWRARDIQALHMTTFGFPKRFWNHGYYPKNDILGKVHLFGFGHL